MIIVQTPLRISLLGGGTDFEDFYLNHGGAVLSTAIDKCVFVIVKERFDDLIYVNYSRKEIVDSVEKLRHDLVREAMRIVGVTKGIEITNLADIPTEGTGLGSSSSFTVGLLNALYAFTGQLKTAEELAEKACSIEIDILGKPIGKQDQYIAAYGNMRFITFNQNGVTLENVDISPDKKRGLENSLLLYYTGRTRKSSDVLRGQKENIHNSIKDLSELRDLAYRARDALLEGTYDDFGDLLHRGWELKRKINKMTSNETIDTIYKTARKSGALGGKILGAGGGGFLLLYCKRNKQDDVRQSLNKLRELPFRFERDGTKVIFNYRRVS